MAKGPMVDWDRDRVLRQLRAEVQELIHRFDDESPLRVEEIIEEIRQTGYRGSRRLPK